MAANGQKLRVAVTKTSAQGKSAQSATPNLMSFSTDENSIWFNGKKYGVYVLKGLENLSADSNTGVIQSFLGDFTYDKWKEAVNAGSIVYVAMSDNILIPASIFVDSSGSLSIMFNMLVEYHIIIIQYSTGSGYSIAQLAHDTSLYVSDINNTLTSSSIDKPLSAAQGKKLNDEKLAKTAVVNNLTTTDTSKALSAAQGKKLNDEKLAKTDVVNNLTTTSTTTPLSAAMGKKLQDEKLAKSDVVNNLTTTDTSKALSAAQGKALNDKISGLGSVYRVKGTKTNLSDVLALTDAKVGDVWNVTNAFTLNSKPYPANTNVVCITATSSSDHDGGNWDPIGGTVDLSPYAKKTEVEESDNEIWKQLNVVVNKDEIVNNLTSTNTDKPLSAAMGKKLQDEKLSKTDANNTYLTKKNAESTYAKKADGISHYSIGELTALSSNPTQEQLKTALGTPSAFRNAIDAGELILVTGHANVQSQKSATCIIDSGNVIVKYLHPGNNDWTVIAKCVPASSGDNWDNAQFSIRTVKPSDSVGITIE